MIFWPSWTVGKIRRRDRKIGPHHGQIDDDEQLALLAFAADQRPEFDPAFGDPARDRRAQFLPAQRLDRLLRQRFDLFRRQAEREQFLAGRLDLDAGILERGARAQEIVLAEHLAFEQPGRAVEQGLLQVEHQPRRQIFALGVGHLAAFDHRDHLAGLDGIAQPLAQFGDRAEQPHRDARDVVAARHDRAGHGNVFAQHAACDFGDGKLAGSICRSRELHHELVMAFPRRLFAMRRDGERRAEHEPGGQQPNPDHFQYPVNGPRSPVTSPNRFLNACEPSHCLRNGTCQRGPRGRLGGQARGGLNSGRPASAAGNCSRPDAARRTTGSAGVIATVACWAVTWEKQCPLWHGNCCSGVSGKSPGWR